MVRLKKASKKEVVVFGTGGHARVLLSILNATNQWKIVGLLDRKHSQRKELIEGYPVIGAWDDIHKIKRERIRHAVIAVGDNQERKRLYQRLTSQGFMIPSLVHPTAYIDPSCVIGQGCVVCMGVLIGTKVRIGSNTVINSGAIIDHESQVGENVHIAPGCRIAGRVMIGSDTLIGIGTTIIDKIQIGENVTIGAGSVVISDIPANRVVYGVPAEPAEKNES